MSEASIILQNANEKLFVTLKTSNKSKKFDTMTIMMTNTTSLEEQIIKISKILKTPVDSVKEKDNQIAYLMSKVDEMFEKAPISTEKFQTQNQ